MRMVQYFHHSKDNPENKKGKKTIHPRDKNNKNASIPNGISRVDLRRRAEETLNGNPLEMGGLSTQDIQFVIHELQVHQVELQLQNDELRRLQLELEFARQLFKFV